MSIVTVTRKACDLSLGVLAHLTWLPPLIARIVIGLVFTWSGWGKLHNLPKMVEQFREWGIPWPEVQTPFAAGTELVCGVLILIGLVTRLASVPLIVVMIVALATAKHDDLAGVLHDDGFKWFLNELFGLGEFLYIVLLLWLVIAGPGAISLDRLLFRKGPEQPPAPK